MSAPQQNAVQKINALLIEVGAILVEQKKTCGRGKWNAWIKANLPLTVLTPETAQIYMESFYNSESNGNTTPKSHSESNSTPDSQQRVELPKTIAQRTLHAITSISTLDRKTANKISKETGIGETSLRLGLRIKKNASPEVIVELQEGRMTLNAAELTLPKNNASNSTPVKNSVRSVTSKRVVTPEEAAREQELLERSKRSVPWPHDANPHPIDPEGEVRTRQIRDAVVRLRNAEPHIGSMPNGENLRNVFSDTKKIYLFRGTIDPLLKTWCHDVNGKATAREHLLYEARRWREDLEADEEEKRFNKRRPQKIHGFEAAWLRFEQVLKAALQKSVFCLEDEEQLLSATTEFLRTHFNTLRQRAAKSASAGKLNASGEGKPKVAN